MPLYEPQNFSIYQHRRQKLLQEIKSKNAATKNGAILLLGALEDESVRFSQESTFYYFTGIEEPGAALLIQLNGESTLFVPSYKGGRAQWISSTIDMDQTSARRFGFDKIDFLGAPCAGYACYTFFANDEYRYLVTKLTEIVGDGGTVFTCNPPVRSQYATQKQMLRYINDFMCHPNGGHGHDFISAVADISDLIARMRAKKDKDELELIYKAVDITNVAHAAAAQLIKSGKIEYEVQAGIEFVFTESGATIAFPSIVAGGKNSTILHYTLNNGTLQKGDLVVIDIGARYNYYCADLSRTYPVVGTFNKRQRKIYNLVLSTQEYIAEIAKPGMWLSNNDYPDQSLNHLAKKFLDEHGGYGKYMPHGIGHYLGLDVHDVAPLGRPLQEGDVFTIEPGVYLSEEKIGVRIEDNYWMGTDGVICLSADLPKLSEQIEQMVQEEIA